MYYILSFFVFNWFKKKNKLTAIHFLPFLAIPLTADYIKRDFWVRQQEKEYKEFNES